MPITVTLTPTAALSLSSDGPISDAAWRAAQTAERAHRARRATARVRVGRITMLPHIAVDLMAGAIARCALERGEVTRADFERLGLSATQIDQWRDAAWRRACALDPRVAECLA